LEPLQSAVAEYPESTRANFEFGRALLQLNRLPAAIERFEAAVRIDPANSAAHLLLGKSYIRTGRRQDGERHLKLGQR
ncbi:MAG: tetratricopeptide repeat protein, partial [Bryobacteraceae bacterium]